MKTIRRIPMFSTATIVRIKNHKLFLLLCLDSVNGKILKMKQILMHHNELG